MTAQLELRDDVVEGIRAAQQLAVDDVAAGVSAYRALLATLDDDAYSRACVKHMYAVIVDDPHEKMRINTEALADADSVAGDGFPFALKATLYAAIGYSHLGLGDAGAARPWYERAAEAAALLGSDDYGDAMRAEIAKVLTRLSSSL